MNKNKLTVEKRQKNIIYNVYITVPRNQFCSRNNINKAKKISLRITIYYIKKN